MDYFLSVPITYICVFKFTEELSSLEQNLSFQGSRQTADPHLSSRSNPQSHPQFCSRTPAVDSSSSLTTLPRPSSRTFLPPTHPVIPASNISRHSLGTHQLSRPGRTAKLTEDLHFLLSSKANLPVKSLVLQRSFCSSLPTPQTSLVNPSNLPHPAYPNLPLPTAAGTPC